MTDHERIGKTETVVVNHREFSGHVYHVRLNGWACVESHDGRHVASGPPPRSGDDSRTGRRR